MRPSPGHVPIRSIGDRECPFRCRVLWMVYFQGLITRTPVCSKCPTMLRGHSKAPRRFATFYELPDIQAGDHPLENSIRRHFNNLPKPPVRNRLTACYNRNRGTRVAPHRLFENRIPRHRKLGSFRSREPVVHNPAQSAQICTNASLNPDPHLRTAAGPLLAPPGCAQSAQFCTIPFRGIVSFFSPVNARSPPPLAR
jgi:hypothetical protein